MMLHRVFALVLVAAMMASPLALVVCHSECADAATNREATHHSCHSAAESAAVSVTAVPHLCGHTGDEPVGLERALQTVAAPVAVVPVVPLTPSPTVGRVFIAEIQHSPPGSFQLVSQLRV
jgi:hypothetical protein